MCRKNLVRLELQNIQLCIYSTVYHSQTGSQAQLYFACPPYCCFILYRNIAHILRSLLRFSKICYYTALHGFILTDINILPTSECHVESSWYYFRQGDKNTKMGSGRMTSPILWKFVTCVRSYEV